MEFTAAQIAGIIHATIVGDPDARVDRLAKIEEGVPGALSFLGNPKYTPYIYQTRASIVIVNDDFIPEQPINATLLKVPNAYAAFASLLEVYNQIMLDKVGISDKAHIASTAKVGQKVYIGAFAFIGENAVIGDGAKIYPQVYIGDNAGVGEMTMLFSGVKVYSGCQVGNNCILHSGVVVGSDGFGFAQDENKVYQKIPQIGNVIIEDNVEIGANTTIDRATLGSTVISKGVKIDNLVQIAHNVSIGENTVIVSQAGIAGSTKIGNNCQIGGQVGIVGHLSIADDTRLAAKSGIENSILVPGTILMGAPAFEMKKYLRAYVHFRNFSAIVDRLNTLEKSLAELKNK